ncbi:alcohol dehydrogenase catalytic domain-containing protein [Myceligenerans pegani]|uniref:alcohol dehydrogenase catalytic domain-containing protein n=1 Tax=Myceligenerans pegani TaxID=2776917 RepID=UPI001CF058FB|nr:alcohol dehydrogenase catalytic domain-containing protein [Myceligenerans sp. TRM 65318]
MKRIPYHQYGGPEVLRLEDFEPARPGSGDVLILVRAAAANPMDRSIRSGAMKVVTGRKFPRGLGHDFAGVVQAVGGGVTRFVVGDRVLGGASIEMSGAFSKMVLATETGVVLKPADLSFEEAAAIPTVGLTAHQAVVRKGRLQPGQSVFINGCLDGVGRAGAQIALARGLGGRQLPRPRHTRRARPRPRPDSRIRLRSDDAQRPIRPTPDAAHRRVPITHTASLTEAVTALTEPERDGTPKGGKLIITTV